MYTLAIPVKPYVKKFIATRYQQNVWQFRKEDRIGKFLWSLLERMPVIYDKKPVNFGESMLIEICNDYACRKGIYLSNKAIIDFNDFVYLEIIEEVAKYIWLVKKQTGIKKYKELYLKHQTSTRTVTHVITRPELFQYLEKREVIYDILKIYNITEDDLGFETISKALQRIKLPLLTAC